MNNVILSLMLAAAIVGMTSALCPPAGCTLELVLGATDVPTTMDYNGETCEICNTWISNDVLDAAGDSCPTPRCNKMAIKEGCARKTSLSWNGQECPWCDTEWC